MAHPHLLRIPRSDLSDGAAVLVKVEPRAHNTLDVKLIGTEGENPYVASIKPSQVKKFRAANYHGPESEWEAILSEVLFQGDPAATKHLEGVETVATVGEDGDLSIIVRKNIGDITQRLGTITLRLEQDEEIALFDWTSMAAIEATKAQEAAALLRSQLEEQQDAVAKLTAQLEELAHAKREHETALLDKFRLLLNAKKQKIRDQQRLLAGAQVNRETAENVESTRNSTALKVRKAGPSRTSKRKAPPPERTSDVGTAAIQGDDAETDEEEQMSVDALTPEGSDLDETEDEEEFDAAPPKSRLGNKGKTDAAAKKIDPSSEEGHATSPNSPEQPPPRRELPFLRHKNRARPETASAVGTERSHTVANDEETDDEL